MKLGGLVRYRQDKRAMVENRSPASRHGLTSRADNSWIYSIDALSWRREEEKAALPKWGTYLQIHIHKHTHIKIFTAVRFHKSLHCLESAKHFWWFQQLINWYFSPSFSYFFIHYKNDSRNSYKMLIRFKTLRKFTTNTSKATSRNALPTCS